MSDETLPLTFITESLTEFRVGEFPPGIMFGQGIVYGVPLTKDNTDTTVFITVSDATGASETQAFDCQVHQPKDDAGESEGE